MGKWYLDFEDLTTCAVGISNRHATWAMPGRRGENAVVPSRDGSIWADDKPFDENEFSLSMWAAGADENGMMPTQESRRIRVRENLDRLTRLFGSGKLLTLAYVEDSSQPYGRRNDISNPSFEAGAGTVVIRENLINNPSGEASTAKTVVRRNHVPNPSFSVGSTDVPIRTNYVLNPRFATDGPITVRRLNRVGNPSFEVNLDRWDVVAGGGTIDRSNTKFTAGWPLEGRYSMRNVCGAGSNAVASQIDVEPGKDFTLSAYGFNPNSNGASRTLRVAIQWRNKKGSSLGTSTGSNTLVAVNTSSRMTVTATAPAGADKAFVRLVCTDAANNDKIFWDRVLVEQSSTVGAYFDGETAEVDGLRHRWVGEDGVSRSQEYIECPLGWGPPTQIAATVAHKMVGAQAAKLSLAANVASGSVLIAQTIKDGSDVPVGTVASGAIKILPGPASAAKSVAVRLRCFSSNGTDLGTVLDPVAGTAMADVISTLAEGTWTEVAAGSGRVRVGTDRVVLQVLASGSTWTAGTDWAYFDEAIVEPSSVPGDWFDGTVPDDDVYDYAWDGDPHWSVSRMLVGIPDSWSFVGGYGRVADDGLLGDTCMRLTANRNPTGALTAEATADRLTLGRDYRDSIYVRPSRTQNIQAFVRITTGTGTGVTTTTLGTSTSCPAGQWTRLNVAALSVPTTALRVSVGVSVVAPADGDYVDVDGALFEATSTLRDFFDGDTGSGYAYEGAPGSSASVKRGDQADGWSPWGTTALPAVERTNERVGTGSYSVKATSSYAGDFGVTAGRDNVDPALNYSFGADVSTSVARTVRFGIRWFDAEGVQVDEDFTDVAVGGTTAFTRGGLTATGPANAAVVSPYVAIIGGSANDVLYIDRAIFGFGTDFSYADGSSGSGWVWTDGIVNGESQQLATKLTSWEATSNITLSQSNTWASDRTYSGKVQVNTATGQQRVVGTGPTDKGFERYLQADSERPITFAIDVRATVAAAQARVSIIPYTWDGFKMTHSADADAVGSKVPIAINTSQRLKLTADFTEATTHYLVAIDFYNSTGAAAAVGQVFYLDRAIAGAGSWDGAFHDGETEGATWEGDADDSPSRFVGDARVIQCEVKDAIDFSSVGYGTTAQFVVKLRAPEVFFHDQYKRTAKLAIGRSGSEHTLFPFAGGAAKITDAVTRVYGPLSNIRIVDRGSGAWVKVARTLRANQYVEIDSGEWTVTDHNGKSAIVDTSHGGSPVLLPITPVSNEAAPRITVTAESIGDGARIEMTGRRRFYIA